MNTTPKHAGRHEMWIEARAMINSGWRPRPRHARGGRHASPATRRGRAVLGRVYSTGTRLARLAAWLGIETAK